MLNNRILYLCLLMMITQACKKTVDLKPTDRINEDIAFQTVDDLELGLYGAYASWDGENTMYINALLSDETKISDENRGQGQFEFKWQYTAGPNLNSANSAWVSFYVMIGRINRELNVFDNIVPANNAEATRKERIRGELLALRAIAHFEMLQRYAGAYDPAGLGIPYTTTSDLNARPARATIADVLKGIEDDFTAAEATPIPNAPEVVGSAGVIRLSKAAIAGYRARIALYKKDWENAIAYAADCINLSGKSLADPAVFPLIWTDESEAEVLLKLRRSGGSVGTMWQDSNGDVFFEPSDKLKNLFDRDNDVRFESYFLIDHGADDTALIYKFYESARGAKIVDVKLMRVAEMYLIMAEAYAEDDDLVNAAAQYNALRGKRIDGYIDETFANKQEAINAIMEERARELCYEGFRFFDLKRRKLPVERLVSDVQSTTWQTLSASDYHFLLPIPTQSILSNPNMEQNPDYN
jgi:hypothetical protein